MATWLLSVGPPRVIQISLVALLIFSTAALDRSSGWFCSRSVRPCAGQFGLNIVGELARLPEERVVDAAGAAREPRQGPVLTPGSDTEVLLRRRDHVLHQLLGEEIGREVRTIAQVVL